MKRILILTLAFAISSSLFAQVKPGDVISGNVSDDIDVVISANVVEIDANKRIVAHGITDMNGNFSFTCKNPKNKIQVSYVGLQTVTLPIDRKVYKIKMKSATQIAPVEIKAKKMASQSTGLTIPVKEISVATQTMSMEDVEGLSFASVDEALQGKIAGLDIISNSGNLGAGTSMRLRGVSSINGSAEPLIVVDGNIFDLPDDVSQVDFNDLDNEEQFATLLSVNPEDIKEIKVLKDATASAIWGARGANGVLEITTKRGTTGKTRIDFSYRFTGSWAPEGLNMLDGDGYTMMLKEAYFNPKQSSETSNMVELNYDQSRPMYYYNFNKNTDWVDAVNQFGQTHNYYLTLTGGGEKAKFRISGGYDHQTGTIIKQEMDRFSTRVVLDYDVSDRIRFSTNFSLTYTDNHRNWDGGSTSSILSKAYNAMPNMSIYEYDERGQLTGGYYNMLPTYGSAGMVPDGYSSYYLSDMKSNGNPVAIANLAHNNQSTYRITPQFNLRYKLLSKDDEGHQLDLNAEVYMDIYNESVDANYPAALTTEKWTNNNVNSVYNSEYKSLGFTNKETLIFTPHFNNRDIFMQMLGRFEFTTGDGTSQNYTKTHVPTGLDSPIADGYLQNGGITSSSERKSAAFLFQYHVGLFDSRYAFDIAVRRDGSTKFGAGKKWGTFPGISARWNISDEPFFRNAKWTKPISLLSFRPGWGRTGGAPGSEYLMYNRYADFGTYGANGQFMAAIAPDNLRLTDIQWETLEEWNFGGNLGLFDDKLSFAFDYYNRHKKDLLMSGVAIPGSTGFSSLPWKNVGELKNEGWELYINTRRLIKAGKFSMDAYVNLAQNINTILEMDPTVLQSMNPEYGYSNKTYLQRIQIGNAVGSIYGFKYKGVYAYDYEHSGYTDQSFNTYGNNTAKAAAERGDNATCPVARDANGNVLFDGKGNPLHMYFDYGNTNYEFKGGDAIYEDINHDGQINELDIVYLGNSNAKFNGGFGLTFNYDAWSLKLSFNFRAGNQIVNMARLNNECMLGNTNQSKATAWRWRKNGDDTWIPRAMNNSVGVSSYNSLGSDRYVEDGDYLRLQYMQLNYNFPAKKLKPIGLRSLRLSLSAQNIFCLTKYTGVDPEVSYGAWGVCYDNSKTPRAKSFTFSVNVGF